MKLINNTILLTLLCAGTNLQASRTTPYINIQDENAPPAPLKKQKIIKHQESESPYNSGDIENFKVVMQGVRDKGASHYSSKLPKIVFKHFPHHFQQEERNTSFTYKKINVVLSDVENELLSIAAITTPWKQDYKNAKKFHSEENLVELNQILRIYDCSDYEKFKIKYMNEMNQYSTQRNVFQEVKMALLVVKSKMDEEIANALSLSKVINELKAYENDRFNTSLISGWRRVKCILADVYAIDE